MGTTVQQAIEELGVPLSRVDLILVNGAGVQFDFHLNQGDRVTVYPVFESFDISEVSRLRESPLRQIRFILDVHLGKLARLLRMLGFDALYRNDFTDRQIIQTALKEKRIILSRDRELLQNRLVTHGYHVRQTQPIKQISEVVQRLQLEHSTAPFSRCLACNSGLERVSKEIVGHRLSPRILLRHNEFLICPQCQRIYWKGSHYDRMVIQLAKILKRS
jgi:uncharacterized protein with PIN domain